MKTTNQKQRHSNSGKLYNRTRAMAFEKTEIHDTKRRNHFIRFDCLYCAGTYYDFTFKEAVDIDIGYLWLFQHLIKSGEIKTVTPGIWMCKEHIHMLYANLEVTTA